MTGITSKTCMSAPALYPWWRHDVHQLPDLHPVQSTRVSLIFYIINWNRMLHSKLMFCLLTLPACKILDRSVHVSTKAMKSVLHRLCLHVIPDGGSVSASSPQKWHQNCTATAHLYWPNLCLCCSTRLGAAGFTKVAIWRRRGKKLLVLHEITNMPGHAPIWKYSPMCKTFWIWVLKWV